MCLSSHKITASNEKQHIVLHNGTWTAHSIDIILWKVWVRAIVSSSLSTRRASSGSPFSILLTTQTARAYITLTRVEQHTGGFATHNTPLFTRRTTFIYRYIFKVTRREVTFMFLCINLLVSSSMISSRQ